jgi:hypothetical protein
MQYSTKIQATEGKVEISHNRYATQAHVHQFIATTLKIPITTTKVPDIGRGSAGSPATGRKPISVDRSNHRRDKGGFEELNIPTKPKQKQGQT